MYLAIGTLVYLGVCVLGFKAARYLGTVSWVTRVDDVAGESEREGDLRAIRNALVRLACIVSLFIMVGLLRTAGQAVLILPAGCLGKAGYWVCVVAVFCGWLPVIGVYGWLLLRAIASQRRIDRARPTEPA